MLRFLAEKMGVGVGKNENAVVAMNGTDLSAGITRQASVAYWIDIASAHLLTHLDARRDRQVTLGVNANGERNRANLVRGERRARLGYAGSGDAAVNLLRR